MTNKKQPKTKQLTTSQQKELNEWEEKVKDNTKAVKEAEDFCQWLETPYDRNRNMLELAREVIPKMLIKKEKLSKKEQKILESVAYIQGVDTGISMLEAVDDRFRGMVLNLRRQIVKEYNCQSYTEKALADMIVNAYWRNLNCSKRLNRTLNMGHTTALINPFLSIMSKEIDRANRHFITALETLKQFKQPELKVNVKTKNAFISQNQQINAGQNKQDENINPK